MKKRILSIALAIFMVLSFVPTMVFAETLGDYEYSVTYGEVTITKYKGSATDVTIPNTINGYPVKAIGQSAFEDFYNITSVVIPNGLTSIEKDAFNDCIKLKSINIPDGVTSIGEGAFYRCESLTDITIPDSVTFIGNEAFRECIGLKSIVIPNSINSISDSTFTYCFGLTDITIPNSVTSIGDYAFLLVNNVIYNGTISNEILRAKAVNGYVENGLVYADNTKTALLGFSELKNGDVVLPDSVRSIGNNAFESCTSLTNITIPNSVTSIGEEAFFGCSSLTNVKIPDSVTSIGIAAFYLVNNVIYNGTISNEILCAKAVNGYIENGLVYADDTKAALLGFSELKIGDVVLPNSVKSIGRNAFKWCTGLTSIVIPNSVTSIGEDAFSYCSGLTDITIPDSVTILGPGAFKYCKELKNVTLSDSITSIEMKTFENCTKLTRIEISDGVTSIGEGAFSGCKGLISIECPNDVAIIYSFAFYDCISLEKAFISNNTFHIGYGAIPDNTTKIRYNADKTKSEATITEINLITDKTKVDLPATICDYSIAAVIKSEHSKVGNHTCVSDGTATCLAKANCTIAGEVYGDVDPDTHEKGKVWIKNETQHKQYWECCNATVLDYENHSWSNGVCSVCNYHCAHKDTNTDHKCDYGCSVAIGQCRQLKKKVKN